MAPLTPYVLFALRRAHGHAVRELDDARDDAVRTHNRAEEARRVVAERTAEEAELRKALEAHTRAEAEESAMEAAEDRERDRAGLTVPLGSLPQALPQAAELAPHPADTRRARESWEQ